VNDSSYTVSGNALKALFDVDSVAALNEAKRLAPLPAKGSLASAITTVIIASGDESSADLILSRFEKLPLSQAKFQLLQSIVSFLAKAKSMDVVKRGVDDIVTFRDAIPEAFKSQTDGPIQWIFEGSCNEENSSGIKRPGLSISNQNCLKKIRRVLKPPSL